MGVIVGRIYFFHGRDRTKKKNEATSFYEGVALVVAVPVRRHSTDVVVLTTAARITVCYCPSANDLCSPRTCLPSPRVHRQIYVVDRFLEEFFHPAASGLHRIGCGFFYFIPTEWDRSGASFSSLLASQTNPISMRCGAGLLSMAMCVADERTG